MDHEDESMDERYASQRAVCMAAHRCLLLSPILGVGCKLGRHCVPVLEIPNHPLMQHKGEDAEDGSNLYTWKALNSVYATLLKHSEDSTAIYVHATDMHYHASPLGSLGPGCPLGTALLAQVVLDFERQKRGVEDQWGLSILIFDAMQIGREDFVQLQMPPTERYARLRKLCVEVPNVLCSPAMKLQWAGQYGALQGFCTGPGSEKNLGHITDSFFRYTQQHPCKIVAVE